MTEFSKFMKLSKYSTSCPGYISESTRRTVLDCTHGQSINRRCAALYFRWNRWKIVKMTDFSKFLKKKRWKLSKCSTSCPGYISESIRWNVIMSLSSIYPHRGKIVLNILCVHSSKSFSKVVPNPNLNISVFPYIIIFHLSPPPCQILWRRGQIEDYIYIYPSPSDETLTWRRGQMEDYNIGKDTYV